MIDQSRDPEYHAFVDGQAKYCRCDRDCPCAGVLAGGMCDEACQDADYDSDESADCHTCAGEGWVDSVADETGRFGWDDDAPGTCPNCNGSGDAKDCSYC